MNLAKHFLLFLLIHFTTYSLSQAPHIQWQKTYGSSGNDEALCIAKTMDGGYIVSGIAALADGDITEHHGGELDYWITKLNASGGLQWQKSFGGSGLEFARSIRQTTDGGYIVAGETNSSDGNVTLNHGSYDAWILKLDTSGNIQWQKSFGGTGPEGIYSIVQTHDDGYVFTGYTGSSDGDVTSQHGGHDGWIVKLNSTGNLQWQKTTGGSNWDELRCVKNTADNGLIFAGATSSSDGDVINNHGSVDQWIIKTDGNGNLQWQKTIGGSGEDVIWEIQTTIDDGYIAVGNSGSNDGDITSNHGSYDFSVSKLNSLGTLEWQRSFGGSAIDNARSVQQTTNEGYVIAGETTSNDGDIVNFKGLPSDWWILQLDNAGNLQWQKTLGGVGVSSPEGDDEGESACSILTTSDGGYIIAGWTTSDQTDVTENHGLADYWVVKLTFDATTPVKLISFDAYIQANIISINWQTSSELDVRVFILEKSNDGVHFTAFKEQAANNTNALNSYSIKDTQVLLAPVYYRLKQVDIDGKYIYSKIAVVRPQLGTTLNFWTSTTKDMINILWEAKTNDESFFQIVDNSGKLIAQKKVTSKEGINNVTFSIFTFPKGIYYIRMIQDKNLKVVRFIN